MKTKPSTRPDAPDLRGQAEAKMSERKKNAAALRATESGTTRLVHELEVHQIELEMQNEELAQSRAEVEALLHQYTDLYDFAPVGYLTLARDGEIHQVNLAGANLLGGERGTLMKRRLGVFVSTESRTTFSTFLEKVFGSQQKETCEVAFQKDGATPLWVHVEAIREDGQREVCHAAVVDITGRQRAEEALRDSEVKFRQTFDLSPVGIVIVGLDKRFLSFNLAFLRFLGYSGEELAAMTIADVSFGEDEDIGMAEMMALMRGEITGARVDKRYVRKDGTVVWGEVTISLVRDHEGHSQYFLAIIQDTTERKQSETELRRLYELSERSRNDLLSILEDQNRVQEALSSVSLRQEAILAAVPDVIVEVDTNKVYTWANRSGIEFFGDDVVGKEASFYFAGDQETYKTVQPLFDGSENTVYLESWQRRKDGQKRFLGWWCRVLKDANGKVIGALSSARDITDHKRAEEEIQKLNTELEQRVIDRTAQLEVANKELEAFSYSVSHDLRAPLRSIDGFSQALLEDYQDKLDELGKSHLLRVRNAAQRMAQLIDDVLDLSRIHRAEMIPLAIDLTTMANEIIEDLRRQQPRPRVEVMMERGMSAVGDPALIRLCLQNLLENAWKFTSKHDRARIEFGSREGDGSKVFFVKDDGAGFDMALHAQADVPGTGVGLASAQRIIHRHGGKIWAEGEVEKGATFFFSL
jgi:PAS domain S-box-containing protein